MFTNHGKFQKKGDKYFDVGLLIPPTQNHLIIRFFFFLTDSVLIQHKNKKRKDRRTTKKHTHKRKFGFNEWLNKK
jgi:hypothetical protein